MRNLRMLILLIAIVGLLGALGYWNFNAGHLIGNQTSAISDPQDIDFYISASETRQYREDGALDYVLQTRRTEHRQSTDLTYLEQPVLDLVSRKVPWKIQSLRGEALPGMEEIELIDDVRVRQIKQQDPLILTTTRMTVIPDGNYAQTAQPVKIKGLNGVTTAIGMKILMDDSKMFLHSEVEGRYEMR